MPAADSPDHASSRRRRRELLVALAIAFALVIARSWVFAAYEHAYFDSDQAVIGLMAKHLSEGRAFPLFMYGQPYLLAVESWLAVPVFWLMGPTVAALRTSLILSNLAVAALLVVGLHRGMGLRPMLALVPALFFCVAPPFLASELIDAGGGNILPLLVVLQLWMLRQRPAWFGALLAVGFLIREFTVVAAPVLLLPHVVSGRRALRPVIRAAAVAAASFLLVVASVHALQRVSDPMGPGTRGDSPPRSAESQLTNVGNRLNVNPGEMPERIRAFAAERLPELLGARTMSSPFGEWGHGWLSWLLAAGIVAGVIRIAMRSSDRVRERSRGSGMSHAFAWFLIAVGLATSAVYVVARPADAPVHRYFLLAIYVPIGFSALWLAVEPGRWWRAAAIVGVVAWAGAAGLDHWRLYRSFAASTEPDPVRETANALDAQGIRIAKAEYWRAYKITFLTRERVRIASEDYVRIEEYQKLAEAQGDRLFFVRDDPCPGGARVGAMYLCR